MNVFKSVTTKKIAANTIYQVIGKIITMFVTILVTMIITRIYGREGYGYFSLMQVIPAIFFVIVDFGINAIATRELSADWSKASKYLGNIVVIRIVMALLFILIVNIGIVFMPYSPELQFGLYIGMFLILTQALFATTNIIFQTKLKYDYSMWSLIAGSTVILVLVLVLSHFRVSVAWVNFSYVIGGVVSVLFAAYFVTKMGIKTKLEFDLSLWKFLFIQALPLGIMLIFSQINFKVDTVMLSFLPLPSSFALNNTETVAVYGLAFKIFEVMLVFPTFFMNATYPVYVRHSMQGSTRLKTTFFRSFGFLTLCGIIFGIIAIVFAPIAINIVGGGEFSQSILLLRVLAGGVVVFYMTQPISWLLVTLKKQIYLPFIYLIGAIVNLVGNTIFIPQYSFLASAVLTWVSEFVILLLLIIFAYRAWRLNYAKAS